MVGQIGNNHSTEVEGANGTNGGDMRSPVPSSLQRHIFHINGAKDFLNKEKAIKGSNIATNYNLLKSALHQAQYVGNVQRINARIIFRD